MAKMNTTNGVTNSFALKFPLFFGSEYFPVQRSVIHKHVSSSTTRITYTPVDSYNVDVVITTTTNMAVEYVTAISWKCGHIVCMRVSRRRRAFAKVAVIDGGDQGKNE